MDAAEESFAGFGDVRSVKCPDSCSNKDCNLDAVTIHDSQRGGAVVKPGYFYRRIRMSFGRTFEACRMGCGQPWRAYIKVVLSDRS